MELRPQLLPAEAPLTLCAYRPLHLGAVLGPVLRGVASIAVLSLLAFGPLAADRLPARTQPEAAGAAVASLVRPSGGAAARFAQLRGSDR